MQVGDGICCVKVWADGNGNCCWAIGCSDGSGDGACSTCQVAKVGDSESKRKQKKDVASRSGEGIVLAQLLVRDKELSRALRSIR